MIDTAGDFVTAVFEETRAGIAVPESLWNEGPGPCRKLFQLNSRRVAQSMDAIPRASDGVALLRPCGRCSCKWRFAAELSGRSWAVC
jgi:hypothetical protein